MAGMPALMYELALIPGLPVKNKLAYSEIPTDQDYATLEQSRLTALGFASTPEAHTDLGTVYLTRAQKAENAEARQKWARKAVDHLEASLKMARMEPYVWQRLSSAYAYTVPIEPWDRVAAWQASVDFASFDPRLVYVRLHIGIMVFNDMSPDQQALLRDQAALTYRFSKLGMRQYGQKNGLIEWFAFLLHGNEDAIAYIENR